MPDVILTQVEPDFINRLEAAKRNGVVLEQNDPVFVAKLQNGPSFSITYEAVVTRQVGGAVIDDTQPGSSSTYSGHRIEERLTEELGSEDIDFTLAFDNQLSKDQ